MGEATHKKPNVICIIPICSLREPVSIEVAAVGVAIGVLAASAMVSNAGYCNDEERWGDEGEDSGRRFAQHDGGDYDRDRAWPGAGHGSAARRMRAAGTEEGEGRWHASLPQHALR